MVIDTSDCSHEFDTCPVMLRAISDDSFLNQMRDIDPDASDYRRLIAFLFEACSNGNCPVQDTPLREEIIRRREFKDKDN